MTGIEKIQEMIVLQANEEVEAIKVQCENSVQEILQKAQSECIKIADDISNTANVQAQKEYTMAVSAMGLKKRQTILSAKQNIISQTINEAKNKILAMEKNDYFELLMQLIKSNVQKGEGLISFNKKDLNNLPSNFESLVNKELANQNSSLKVTSEPVAIDGGFILSYNGIEENCSIEAIFHAKEEQLKDETNRLLFM